MQDTLAFFAKNGYAVVPQALSVNEVQHINAAIDRHRSQYQPLWLNRGENGRWQSVHGLLACPEMDVTMRPPTLLPLMQAILGDDICAEEHSVMVREPNPKGPTLCAWHRDTSHVGEPPYFTKYLSVVYYLTHVNVHTHTFSVLPGASQSEVLQPLNAFDLNSAQHLEGTAGTAILFNAALFHAGNVRQTAFERRTIHIYCGRSTDPYLSNHTIFPRRLWEGKDEATQRYYSRPNPLTKLLIEQF